jgi:hypothetical protein
VVLFELLTLQSPFLVRGNTEETRRRILKGRAPSSRKLNAGVSREVALVCGRATTKAEKIAGAARLDAYRGHLAAAQHAILSGEIPAAKHHLGLAPKEHRA